MSIFMCKQCQHFTNIKVLTGTEKVFHACCGVCGSDKLTDKPEALQKGEKKNG